METLTEVLEGWQPGTVTATRRVDPWMAGAFAGLIGTPAPGLGPGAPLPPMWHWFTLLGHPATSEIGADGHPEEGPFLPPIPGRRRMFAGGRLRMDAPVPIGTDLTGTSNVTNVTVKRGRTGEMAFVTVRTEMSVDGQRVGAEEQDIVYRSEPPGTEPRVLGRTVPARGDNNPPKPPRRDSGGGEPEPEGDWRLSLDTDPVLLFRFSALTYNGHRIHYDRDYATSAEGYPERVIHGPLLALLALELPRLNAPGKTVTSFEYRLTRPAFLPSRLVSAGGPGGDSSGNEATLAVAAVGAAPSLTAKATLA